MPPQFSHQNTGFINYVFCRNWAVRNPAGTRLDSSLVNKQVVVQYKIVDYNCGYLNAIKNSIYLAQVIYSITARERVMLHKKDLKENVSVRMCMKNA